MSLSCLLPRNFNSATPTCMHVDFNACFASIEQQANPLLRGKPIVVAAYTTPSGCIVAPSIEAKQKGIRVGMRVAEARLLCPEIVVLSPDPSKYRWIHLKLKKLLSDYTNVLIPKSIDEFVLDLKGCPRLSSGIKTIAKEIKYRITQEIGDWLTVSIGIGPNRFLAKTAAGLHKPDGLDEINADNFKLIYQSLCLSDLCGINSRTVVRLNQASIFSVMDFYQASIENLKAAFDSIVGYYWYLRLRGFEIDETSFCRKSFGNSYALPQPAKTDETVTPLLVKLVYKMGQRLRRQGYYAGGVCLNLGFTDGSYWHKSQKAKILFDSRDMYGAVFKLYCQRQYQKPIKQIAVSCFDLKSALYMQLEMFSDSVKKNELVEVIDDLNNRFGDYVVTPALMLPAKNDVGDRISFGGVSELESAPFFR